MDARMPYALSTSFSRSSPARCPAPTQPTRSPLLLAQIRSSLLVLIQHNIVRPVPVALASKLSAPQPRRAPRGVGRFVYQACLDEVLSRRWYCWVVGMADRRFGQDAALLMEHMLAVGRSNLEELAQGAALSACKGRAGSALAQRTEELDGALQHLREARLLEPVDELPAEEEAGILPMAPERLAPAGRGGRGQRGRGAAAALPVPAAGKRKRAVGLTIASAPDQEDMRALLGLAPAASNQSHGSYRRLWRANLAEARRAFRWEAIGTLVTDKHDETAGMVRLFWRQFVRWFVLIAGASSLARLSQTGTTRRPAYCTCFQLFFCVPALPLFPMYRGH
jgi:hypothetical protein